MPEQTYDYLIAPKASFDATADAVRALNGTNSAITWGQDGFADAIGDERRYTLEDSVQGNFGTLGAVTLPTATWLKPFAFASETTLQSIDAPLVAKLHDTTLTAGVGSHVFYNCTNLTSVNLPSLSSVGSGGYQFSGCTSLTTIYLPLAYCGQYMFSGCTNLLTAVIGVQKQNETQWNGNGFRGCSKLQALDIGMCSRIYSNEFINCTVLNTVIIRQNTIAPLNNVNAFSNTPFASGKAGGTLYVPNSMISSYQSATNWTTILGYATNQIKSIESTHTDPNAPIDLTLYYADGTPIPTT